MLLWLIFKTNNFNGRPGNVLLTCSLWTRHKTFRSLTAPLSVLYTQHFVFSPNASQVVSARAGIKIQDPQTLIWCLSRSSFYLLHASSESALFARVIILNIPGPEHCDLSLLRFQCSKILFQHKYHNNSTHTLYYYFCSFRFAPSDSQRKHPSRSII